VKHHNFVGWGGLIGGGIGSGIGVLLSLLVDAYLFELGGSGLFVGFTIGGMLGDKVFWVIESYRAEIVQEASLGAQKQSVEASKLPDWWPTDDELAASLNPRHSQDNEPEVTIIVPSPRSKHKHVSRKGPFDQA
jgi:predicted lipid-binding transport protein (Tim44 family)